MYSFQNTYAYMCMHMYSFWRKILHFIFLLIYLTSLPKVALFQLHLLTTGYNYSDNLQKANKVFSEMDQKVPQPFFQYQYKVSTRQSLLLMTIKFGSFGFGLHHWCGRGERALQDLFLRTLMSFMMALLSDTNHSQSPHRLMLLMTMQNFNI